MKATLALLILLSGTTLSAQVQLVSPSQYHQTWCHAAIGADHVYFVYHSGQDVFMTTYLRSDMTLLHTQMCNIITENQQDECKIEVDKVTGHVLVAWSDRSCHYTDYMEVVGRIYAPGGRPVTGEIPISSSTQTAWRPLLAPRKHGGWYIAYTADWGEDAFVRELYSNGILGPEHCVNAPNSALGKSQNYPDVVEVGNSFVAVHMDSYERMLTSSGSIWPNGRQPRLGRGAMLWQDPSHQTINLGFFDPDGNHYTGTVVWGYPGRHCRDPELLPDLSWVVWEEYNIVTNTSHIRGSQNFYYPVYYLTPDLGPYSSGELDRRTPNVVRKGGDVILAWSGWVNGRRQACWRKLWL